MHTLIRKPIAEITFYCFATAAARSRPTALKRSPKIQKIAKSLNFKAFFDHFFKFEKPIFQENVLLYIAQKRAKQPEKVKKVRKNNRL